MAKKNGLHGVWIQLLIAGSASLLFGGMIFIIPEISLPDFLWVRAVYMLIKGISLVVVVFRAKGKKAYWNFLLSYEILSIIASLAAAYYPVLSIFILGFIVSISLLLSGILQIVISFYLPREVHRRALLVGSGIITLLAGGYIYIVPKIDADTILVLFGIDLLALGFFLISLSFAVRKLGYLETESL